MFMNVAEELNKARSEKYAIGAFNTNNLEVTKAICAAAKECNAPVIIQVTPGAIEYAGLEEIFDIVKNEIEQTGIEAAIHLDHAKDFETIREAIEVGFRSVMIDGSSLSFEENVALTKKVVDFAHQKNVSVEGEIGTLGKEGEDNSETNSNYSKPDEVVKFVELTGIDAVAVSVGNMHGAPEGEKLNLELLGEIASKVSVPLVLHGSSGLSEEDIMGAREIGVTKINVDTAIRQEFIDSLQDIPEGTDDYRDIFQRSMEAIKSLVSEKIKLFKS